jgi:hypothetical protein
VECLESKALELLCSGGFRAGKTLGLIIKIITQHLPVPNNRGLIGRLTYPELKDTVQKDFFALMPKEWIAKWNESRGELKLINGTEVLFRHLDNVSEMEIRGLNLGFAYISQVEEISFNVYEALLARLSLQHVPNRQLMSDCNPLLFWGYKHFKEEMDDDRKLIEFSMLDNKENLTQDYLKLMLKRPENWKRQFVHGIWDESLLGDKAVIPIEYIQAQKVFKKEPIRLFNDIKIFKDVEPGHEYQCGVDTSEGVGQDYNALSVVDCETGEQVAFYQNKNIQPELFATMKVVPVCRYFNNATIVPEINNTGLAFMVALKNSEYPIDKIYHREEFDKEENVEKKLMGWRTTFSTKPLLVDHCLTLMREGQCMTRAAEVLNQMPVFVYSDEAKRRGMGAQQGFHDDALICHMLALWNIDPKSYHNEVTMNVNFDNLMGAGRGGY